MESGGHLIVDWAGQFSGMRIHGARSAVLRDRRAHPVRLLPLLRARPQSRRTDLSRLAGLVASGRLNVRIEVEAPWAEVAEVAQKLTERAFTGKAVLHIT